MKVCIYCDSEFPDGRPYDHCMADECVTIWKQRRRADMAIALLPKQGFTVVYRQDVATMPTTTRR